MYSVHVCAFTPVYMCMFEKGYLYVFFSWTRSVWIDWTCGDMWTHTFVCIGVVCVWERMYLNVLADMHIFTRYLLRPLHVVSIIPGMKVFGRTSMWMCIGSFACGWLSILSVLEGTHYLCDFLTWICECVWGWLYVCVPMYLKCYAYRNTRRVWVGGMGEDMFMSVYGWIWKCTDM